MLIIITHFDEPFSEGAKQIKIKSEFLETPCKIITLSPSEIDSKNILLTHNISISDVVYFLTNNMFVIKSCLAYLITKNCFIVNKHFLESPKSKLEAQNIIKKAGVLIPKNFASFQRKSLEIFNKEEMLYPVFVKNNRHCMPVTKIHNQNALVSFFKPLKNVNEWYIEENVESQHCNLQKFYFISGKITHFDATQKISPQIKEALLNISKSLALEVFSADFIIKKSSQYYWCIDVNPASAFFRCDKAREDFINYIKNTLMFLREFSK